MLKNKRTSAKLMNKLGSTDRVESTEIKSISSNSRENLIGFFGASKVLGSGEVVKNQFFQR